MSNSGNGSMSAKELAFYDVEREMRITRKVLEAVPDDKFAWKPPRKVHDAPCMAHHVAQIPEWIAHTLGQDELDLRARRAPPRRRTRRTGRVF